MDLLDERLKIGLKIGFGTFSQVYRAEDLYTGEVFAVKLFHEHVQSAVYFRELSTLLQHEHPNIVKIRSFGYLKTQKYIVYEYLPGGSLRNYLASHVRLSLEYACFILREILRGIDFAHQQKLIHRDLKPENILLSQRTWPFDVKICDFGHVFYTERDPSKHFSFGSPGYMAPEQKLGIFNRYVDIYAIGVIFYEMLFGHLPQQSDSLPTEMPATLRFFLERCLAFSPEQRFQDCTQCLQALQRIQPLNGPLRVQSASSPKPKVIHSQGKSSSRDPSIISVGRLESIVQYKPDPTANASLSLQTLREVSEAYQVIGAWESNWQIRVPMEAILLATPAGDLLVGTEYEFAVFDAQGERVQRWEHGLGPGHWVVGSCFGQRMGWQTSTALHLMKQQTILPPLPIASGTQCFLGLQQYRVCCMHERALQVFQEDGTLEWSAEFQSYGDAPNLSVSGDGMLLWINTKAPYRQLIVMSADGDKHAYTSIRAYDTVLQAGATHTAVVGTRAQRKLEVFSQQGFLVQTHLLASPLCRMMPLSERATLLLCRKHSYVLGSVLKRIPPVSVEHSVYAGGGFLYQVEPKGTSYQVQQRRWQDTPAELPSEHSLQGPGSPNQTHISIK
ncbi:MAG: serine/threonine-protein kinase [Myxococcota bacterium]